MDSSDGSECETKTIKKRYGERNKKCPVKGCGSQSKNGIKFFNFPRDKKAKCNFSPLAKLWSFFTRIKGFEPICTQAMCELHFSDMCVTISKSEHGRKYLNGKSVPTIYYDESGKRIEVLYDPENMEYYGEEAEKIEHEINESAREMQKEIMNLRQKRMHEIKSLCRFCFSSRGAEAKFLPLSRLEAYSIDPMESLRILGLSDTHADAFGELICGSCFEKVVDLGTYRRRCQNSQQEILCEIEELGKRLEEACAKSTYVKGSRDDDADWFNVQLDNSMKNEAHISENEIENLDGDNDFVDGEEEYLENSQHDISISQTVLHESLEEKESNVCIDNIKDEPDFLYVGADGAEEQIVEIIQSPLKKRKKAVFNVFSKKSRIEETSPVFKYEVLSETNEEEIVEEALDTSTELHQDKTKSRILKKSRLFECFFCRFKFTGLRVFNAHECTVKRVKCQVDECESYFVNQGGYNQHIYHRHGLPKVSKNFCPVCYTVYQMNVIQFDEHCKRCIEVNEYREQQIQCVQCKKICDNLQSYTAHIMLHDTEGLKPIELDEEGKPIVNRKGRRNKESKMCDLCGKVFDASGLQRHKQNVHFVNFTGEMFYCDLCPIAKPTKRLLYNHMKGTHIIKWHGCETCGKMFRNRELWRKHQLIHGDFKKNNRCDVCPHRPGFVTKAALNKHMRSNHGGAQPVRKYTCDICRASYSRDDLLIRHRANVHQIYQNNYTEEIISQYIKY